VVEAGMEAGAAVATAAEAAAGAAVAVAGTLDAAAGAGSASAFVCTLNNSLRSSFSDFAGAAPGTSGPPGSRRLPSMIRMGLKNPNQCSIGCVCTWISQIGRASCREKVEVVGGQEL